MSRKLLVCLCLAALVVSAPLLIAQEQKPAENPPAGPGPYSESLAEPQPTAQAGQRAGTRTGTITIVYDDGIVTAVPNAAGASLTFGNQFNSASGDPVTNFTVTQLSFYIMPPAGTDNVFVTVFGPVSGTTAPVLQSISVPLNNGPGAFNTAAVGPVTGSGSFLAGVWYTGGDTPALGTGTVGGQGHHGMVINDIVGTGFTQLTTLNGLVGATTLKIPVELMDFKVTDE